MDIVEAFTQAVEEATRDIKAESRKRLQAISARAEEERAQAWDAYHKLRRTHRYAAHKELSDELDRIYRRKTAADQAEWSARGRACAQVAREVRARLAQP